MRKKVLITAALPYANGPLHFGHIAGAYLPADCYARFHRLLGDDVLFISGSDEYGVAITLSAEMAKRTPQEHVDIFHDVNHNFFKTLNISYDHYSRTTWDGHHIPVQAFFKELYENEYIEERETGQLYSAKDDRFLADRYVVGTCPKCGYDAARGDECPRCAASYEATDLKNPRSKLTGAPLELKSTKHYFLRFDQFKERLQEWLSTKEWKSNVINFAKHYIDELKARAITRDMEWGVPVPLPGTEGKVLYVWFDAPIGYISMTQEWAQKKGDPEIWKKYWCDQETHLVNFIGKDNIPFHAIFFPAMIMGQNQPYKLVDELPANEFYNLEGRQFSKSTGWTIDLDDFFSKYSADQIRYAIAANAPENQDSEFTWKDFQLRCNSELLGKFGNLVNRVLVFTRKHHEGLVPSLKDLQQEDHLFLEKIQELTSEIQRAYSSFSLRKASALVMELAAAGNAYFDAKKPWVNAKSEETRPDMLRTLACCIECLKALALTSSPIIPQTAEKVWKLIGYQDSLEEQTWSDVMENNVPEGQKMPEPEVLFKKIEDETIADEISKLKESLAVSKEPLKEEIEFSDFQKLDLRVGQITACEAIPKSKKLLKLQVDLGFEKRTIVSGIRETYSDPEELIGRRVVVVANLKPVKLMGVESQGMVLAASLEKGVELITPDEAPLGATVS